MKTELLAKLEELLKAEKPLEVQKEFNILSAQYKSLIQAIQTQTSDDTGHQEEANEEEEAPHEGASSPEGEAEAKAKPETRVEADVAQAPAEEPKASEGTDLNENTEDAETTGAPEQAEQAAEQAAEETEQAVSTPDPDLELNARFKQVSQQFKARIAEARAEIKRIEEETVSTARHLLEELQKIVENEENIGKAFAGFNAVQEKWKSLPKVSNDNYRDLNSDYNKLVERFFYNINIYKELKELDLKRNLEEKTKVIEDQKKLIEEKDIRLLEVEVRLNQDRWNEIGPTYKEEWEKIKDEFWSTTREIYKRIHDFYEQRKGEQEINLKAKEELLEKARGIAALDLKSPKKWQERTNEIIEIQRQWKLIGFVPKEKIGPVWKEFRKVCDAFFERKREHFGKLHAEQDANKDIKEKLIAKAEELKDNTDWKETADQIIALQKEWKKTGPAAHKDENRLWRKFRAACDHFFQQRNAGKTEALQAEKENLEKKQSLLDELKAFEPDPAKAKEAIQQLKDFAARYREIGHVPFKEKDRLNKAYKSLMDEKYAVLKIDKKEKDRIRFEEKLELLKSSDTKGRLAQKEKEQIRHKISKIESEINQYENNLGFFANSKGADKLIAEVQKNIEKARDEVNQLYTQLEMLDEVS